VSTHLQAGKLMLRMIRQAGIIDTTDLRMQSQKFGEVTTLLWGEPAFWLIEK
jgi:hypothetical protein